MKRSAVVLAGVAHTDIKAIVEYYLSIGEVAAAERANAAIDQAMESLATMPSRGRVVPELRKRGVSRYREVLATPFRIIYRVSSRQVHVLAIVDHRRDATHLLLERAQRY